MFRSTILVALAATLCACGPRIRPMTDAGEEDAGVGEVDAGRQRGTDPANGFQAGLELPMGAAAATRLGVSLSAAGDQFGQPLVAGLYEDPNGDANRDDTRVFFSRWDGAAARFEDQKTVEVVGPVEIAHPNRQVSIARDADTGRVAIAYVKQPNNTIRLAVSDDEGANFSLQTVSDEPSAALASNPSLALAGGATHVAWIQGSELKYRSRTGTAAWAEQSPGALFVGGRAVSLALDSAGNPGVAFFVAAGAASADLVFWRPGAAPVPVASADLTDLTLEARKPSVSLVFVGTTPHVAFHLRKVEPLASNDDTTELWYAKATDTGMTWSTPVAIPRNGDGQGAFHSTQWYQALTVEQSGRVSVAANWQALGNTTNCLGPKLARSVDGTSFMTCSPASTPVQRAGQWISAWQHRPGKLTLVFHYDARANPGLKPGVALWREP